MDNPYSKELWETYFYKFCEEDILKLAKSFPYTRNLVVEYKDIEHLWGEEAVSFVITHPEIAIIDGINALRAYPLKIKLTPEKQKRWLAETGIKIRVDPYNAISIRDIRQKDINTFVTIRGVILRKTDVKYQLIRAAFKCQRCDHISVVHETGTYFVEPYECENEVCGRKGPFKLVEEESVWADKRKIRLQERFDDIQGGEQSLVVLDAVMLGDVECPPLGSVVTVSGILRGIQTTAGGQKTLDYYPLLEINHIETFPVEKELQPSLEELKEMEKWATDENIIDRLVASTVPSVRGHENIKEAILCIQVSPDDLLLPDGRMLRGRSHVMLCGDPGVAKSVLLRAMCGNVPRSQYAAGRSASSRGLTVAVSKDKGGWGEGAWVAEAGMLVLADGAFAVVDELDKFEKEEQQDLNTVLEHGIVPVRKAGINRDFNARVPIAASLNPKYGRFDTYEPIPKQINVPPDTLSRFDLIFMMLDEPNEHEDTLTSEHITRIWEKATEVHQRGEYRGTSDLTVKWGKDEFTPEISLDMMRKWVIEAKKIKVRITKECRKALNDFFLGIRKQYSGDKNSAIPIAWRTLDGMMRLLICETRLRHGRVTEMRDVERVKALVSESFKVMIDPTTGEMDSDIISTGTSRSQRDRIKVLREIIRELQEEYESAVPLDDIIAKAQEAGMDRESVEDMLEKLKTAGDILEVSNNRYRTV